MVDGVSQWSAKVTVTVIGARGLAAMDSNGTSDPYVTLHLGKRREKTKTQHKCLDPSWNQTFTFDCQNSIDRLIVRVWDEDEDIKSRIIGRIGQFEQDDFMGQVAIDIRTLCGEMDVWYNLENRSEGKEVGGAIHLKLHMELKGEDEDTIKQYPYHVQYSYLHEVRGHSLLSANDMRKN